MKVFITGMHSSLKHEFMYYLEHSLPQYFKVGRVTSSDPYYKSCRTYKYYTDNEIKEIFDNRAFVFLHDGFGLIDSVFTENNLFTLSVEDFLLIPNKIYNKNDVLILWIDTSKTEREKNYELRQRNFAFNDIEESLKILIPLFVKNLTGKKVMYFRDETGIEMLSRVLLYLECDDEKKKQKMLDTEF